MKKAISLLSALLLFYCGLAQIPKLGNDTLLDVAAWNVEWLGDESNGPTDENLQYANVKNLLSQADFDVISLEEMSSDQDFFNLSDQLFSKYGAINSTFDATQKMCLFYKKSMFEIIPSLSGNILLQYASNAFATRPPLQVALKTLGGNHTDTLYFIVVHLKAHTGTTSEKQSSYYRRQEAAGYLKTYIEQNTDKKFIVLGDWNDGLSKSLYNSVETPFKQLLDAGYTFVTKPLADAGKRSYAFGSTMIDHMMPGKATDSLYISNSAAVFDNISNYIANYSSTTSDHYPIYARFDWKKLTTKPTIVNSNTGIDDNNKVSSFSFYPNPAKEFISFSQAINSGVIYDAVGKIQFFIAGTSERVDISWLPNGVYFIYAEKEGEYFSEKLVISR